MRNGLGLPSVILLVSLSSSGIAGQANRPIDVTGTWEIEITLPAGPSAASVVLEQRGAVVSGDYSSFTLGQHKVQGTIAGTKLEFSFAFARARGGPENTTVVLTGTISAPDEWKGSIKLTPGNAGTFSAKRRANVEPVASWRDPSPHRSTMVTVERDVALEVLDWGGSGRPLVMLAGQGNSAHIFDDFVPRLLPLGHVYGITRRGYGQSSAPKQGYDADRLADDVLAVLDALKLERPILIGHSVAGEELNSLGARYPLRAAGLVYLDAVGDRTVPLPPDYISRMSVAMPRPRPSPADLASVEAFQAFRRKTIGWSLPEGEVGQLFAIGPDGRVGPSRRQGLEWVDALIDAGVRRPDYARFRVPALSIQSLPPASVAEARALNLWDPDQAANVSEREMNDIMSAVREVTGAQIAAFEKGVTNAKNVYLIGANHYDFATNPDDVLREIRAFVESVR